MSKVFDPANFGKIAKEIVENVESNAVFRENREAFLRTAISRAYYSAFLLVREKMRLEVGIVSKSPEVHREVMDWVYKKFGEKKYQMLLNLRFMRNDADYELEKSVDINDAKLAVELFRRIVGNLDSA